MIHWYQISWKQQSIVY